MNVVVFVCLLVCGSSVVLSQSWSVYSLSQGSSPLEGGANVSITVVFYDTTPSNNLTMYFGSVAVETISVPSLVGKTWSGLAPPAPVGKPGFVTLSISVEGSQQQSVTDFMYYEMPVITSSSPNTFYSTGGEVLVLKGSGYDGTMWNVSYACCQFGAWCTRPMFVSETEAHCVTPPLLLGPTNFSLTFTNYYSCGAGCYGGQDVVAATNSPVISIRGNVLTSVSPTSGCTTGMMNVTVTLAPNAPATQYAAICCGFFPINSEEELQDPNSLPQALLGDSPIYCGSAQISNNQFICVSPPFNSSGPVAFRLTDYSGAVISNPVKFTYLSDCLQSITPSNLCILGGTEIDIAGTGLPSVQAQIYVSLQFSDGTSAPPGWLNLYIANDTSASFIAPPADPSYLSHNLTVDVTLENSYSTGTQTNALHLIYTPSCLTKIKPSTVTTGGGDLIYIWGSFGEEYYTQFNPLQLSCVFSDPEGFQTQVPTTVYNATVASCVSPATSSSGKGSMLLTPPVTSSPIQTNAMPLVFTDSLMQE